MRVFGSATDPVRPNKRTKSRYIGITAAVTRPCFWNNAINQQYAVSYIMITVRKTYERGKTDIGWLLSRHTFSFGDYYDPCYRGVSVLRVLNDDRVEPGKGFPMHSHRDMEIVTYVTEGSIEHNDSLGNVRRLSSGEIQLMSAGTGVSHSEYNASQDQVAKFLQIWIEPHELGLAPSYAQTRYEAGTGLQLLISPDGRDGTLRIHQDTYINRLLLDPRGKMSQELLPGRTAYIHVVNGSLSAEGKDLKQGDGAVIQHIDLLRLHTEAGTEALFFDLP